MKRIIAATGAALALAAGGHAQAQLERMPAVQQQSGAGQPAHAGAQVQPQLRPGRAWSYADREFLAHAAQSRQAGLEAARLARYQAGHDAVRDYARQLARDHRQALNQLRQLARAQNLRLPEQPSVQQRLWLDALAQQRGPAFDQRFLQQMLDEHSRAIGRLERVAGDRYHDRALHGYARQQLPDLRSHLDQARWLDAAARSYHDRGDESALNSLGGRMEDSLRNPVGQPRD